MRNIDSSVEPGAHIKIRCGRNFGFEGSHGRPVSEGFNSLLKVILYPPVGRMLAVLASNPHIRFGDIQIEFRQVQKPSVPDLSKEEWLNMFGVWLDRYPARSYKRAEGLRTEMPRQQPFRYVCGAVLDDPFAPDVVKLHQPHVMAARSTGDDPTLWTQLAADEAGLNAFVKAKRLSKNTRAIG